MFRRVVDILGKLLANTEFWFAATLLSLLGVTLAHFGYGAFTGADASVNWGLEQFYALSNFLLGVLVSFIFYYLVVAWPARQKKRMLKANLLATYRSIKEDILWQILFASIAGGRHDLTTETTFHKSLLDIKNFRKTFQDGREANEGWYAFANAIDRNPEYIRQITTSLAMLEKQFEFVLHNYEITDTEVFDFANSLTMTIMRLRQTEVSNESDKKILCRFLYQICSGWNPTKGYQDHEPIEHLIGKL